MEFYKYTCCHEDMVSWAFIAAITPKADKSFFEECEKYKETGIPIELKIAGRDFSFTHILKRLEEDFNRQVNEAARNLIKDKVGEIESAFYELSNQVNSKIDELFPKR